VLWTFSIELESVCVLPQLLLLRQTSVPTVLDSFYLVTLGSYRFFYLLNWLVRGFGEGWFDPISVIFGLIQTALYVDFAWVYWSRQRVKLRGGGVVDSDDLSKSFLVKRIIGHRAAHTEDDDADEDTAALNRQENGTVRPSAPRSGRSWGARGISVSADDTLPPNDRQPDQSYADAAAAADAQMVDPSHFEDDDEEPHAPPPPAKDSNQTSANNANPAADEDGDSSAGAWQQNHTTAS
jgi:ER lumen protein retaining receptor